MEIVRFGFIEKDEEVKMYSQLREMLVKKGYKPLNNTTCSCYLDYNRTTAPYNIIISHHYNNINKVAA